MKTLHGGDTLTEALGNGGVYCGSLDIVAKCSLSSSTVTWLGDRSDLFFSSNLFDLIPELLATPAT